MAQPGQGGNWRDFAGVWLGIGALSFGGPAGQIALMHRELVERRGWIDEAAYLRALNFVMLLPGPEAQQLATWCGWRLRGVAGGLIAGLAFVVPGAAMIAALTFVYLGYGQLPLVQSLFFGIQAVVVAIVAQALARVAARALAGWLDRGIAVAAFVLLFCFNTPFPAVVLGAGAVGWWRGGAPVDDVAVAAVSRRASAATALLWAGIWAAPVVGAAIWLGGDHDLVALGRFFAGQAAVTFGGAYAALSYVAQAAVEQRGWLTAPEMIDGLGLAETTPGPLVLVFQFIGGLAGARFDGLGGAGAGLGMAMAVWVTFAPSFLWVFTLAPHLDGLMRRPALASALRAITAAVVGVMANLALWFALHVLFERVAAVQVGWLRLWVPGGAFDWAALGIIAAALILLLRFRLGLGWVVGIGALAGFLMNGF